MWDQTGCHTLFRCILVKWRADGYDVEADECLSALQNVYSDRKYKAIWAERKIVTRGVLGDVAPRCSMQRSCADGATHVVSRHHLLFWGGAIGLDPPPAIFEGSVLRQSLSEQ